jgi:hypothetical protein
VHFQAPKTHERRNRSCANAYERHETYGEGDRYIRGAS